MSVHGVSRHSPASTAGAPASYPHSNKRKRLDNALTSYERFVSARSHPIEFNSDGNPVDPTPVGSNVSAAEQL